MMVEQADTTKLHWQINKPTAKHHQSSRHFLQKELKKVIILRLIDSVLTAPCPPMVQPLNAVLVVLLVMAMDSASSWLRRKLITGREDRRTRAAEASAS